MKRSRHTVILVFLLIFYIFIDSTSYAQQVHDRSFTAASQAAQLAASLDSNFSNLDPAIQATIIAPLATHIAKKSAIQFWTLFAPQSSPFNPTGTAQRQQNSDVKPYVSSSSPLPDGNYTITYYGKGSCNGKYLSYNSKSSTIPDRVFLLAMTPNLVEWMVTNVAEKSNQITLAPINRPSSAKATKLAYRSPSCASAAVELFSAQGGSRWTFHVVDSTKGIYRLDASSRLESASCSAFKNSLIRLGPRAVDSSNTGRCLKAPDTDIILQPANTKTDPYTTWQFTRISTPPSPPPLTPPSPPPSLPSPPPLTPTTFTKEDYAHVLNLSWEFFQANRAGEIPPNYPISYVSTSLLTDPVQPGWYDAGDTLKLNFPLSGSVSFLAWGLVDLEIAYNALGLLVRSKDIMKPAVDYLLNSYIGYETYVGQISEPSVDHNYWGRPSQYPIQQLPRFPFIWNATTAHQADLLGSVAAALASSSIVYSDVDPVYSQTLLSKAIEIFDWGARSEGLYSSVYPLATDAYPSTDWADDMAWGASWLYRATNETRYLDIAYTYWNREPPNPYVCWDSKWAAVAAMLINLSADGKITVPGLSTYTSFMNNIFLKPWLEADGQWGIVSTPLGMKYPGWSIWSNLRYSTTAAMVVGMHALQIKDPVQKLKEAKFAATQLDYAMGKYGFSYIVGYGSKFPLQPHHALASCPDMPAPCGWAQFSSPNPNPQVIKGALVGGPQGQLVNPINPDDSYQDLRSNFACNEVAVDANAGLVGNAVAVWALADIIMSGGAT